MCGPLALPLAVAGSALVGGGVAMMQGSKNRKLQTNIQASNERQAMQQAQRAEESFNKVNQKQPGIDAMMARNLAASKKGIGSTFLTGPAGVSGNPLGGGSLLGG